MTTATPQWVTPNLPEPWSEQYQAMRRLLERLDRGDVALPQRTIRTVMNKVRDLDPKDAT